jgi:hypothetical protein
LMLFLSFGWSIVDSILTLPMSFSCMYACSWASFYFNWIINLLVDKSHLFRYSNWLMLIRCMDILTITNLSHCTKYEWMAYEILHILPYPPPPPEPFMKLWESILCDCFHFFCSLLIFIIQIFIVCKWFMFWNSIAFYPQMTSIK